MQLTSPPPHVRYFAEPPFCPHAQNRGPNRREGQLRTEISPQIPSRVPSNVAQSTLLFPKIYVGKIVVQMQEREDLMAVRAISARQPDSNEIQTIYERFSKMLRSKMGVSFQFGTRADALSATCAAAWLHSKLG